MNGRRPGNPAIHPKGAAGAYRQLRVSQQQRQRRDSSHPEHTSAQGRHKSADEANERRILGLDRMGSEPQGRKLGLQPGWDRSGVSLPPLAPGRD